MTVTESRLAIRHALAVDAIVVYSKNDHVRVRISKSTAGQILRGYPRGSATEVIFHWDPENPKILLVG